MPSPPTSGSADRVSGPVERVTFHSDESGFCVLRVKVRGRRGLTTVVGVLPEVRSGEWIDAEGRWVIDPQHGQQFKANRLQTTQPGTAEGVERYLASGMIKGIGPELARRLVGKFGADVLKVIESSSRKLRQVEGIGPKRLAQITDAWARQRVVRQIMVFLHGHGVSTQRAFRIYKTYGPGAIERIRHDPYCLAQDIRGIGFATADKIAASIGIGAQSDLRARAGVGYVLGELTGDGHCAFDRAGLVQRSADMLDIPAPIVEAAIDHEIAARRLVEAPGPDGPPLVYLAPLHRAETRLAEDLVALLGGRHPCPGIDLDKAVAWVEGKVHLTLAPQQREALKLATSAKLTVITGGPGVGKTTLVDAIVRVLRAKRLAVVLCAPTGRAAKRLAEATHLQAKTIHRLLAFDPATGGFKHDRADPLDGDVFVVDETSMVDLTLAHQLVRAIPPAAALILVGDVDQLPSVGPGSVLRDIIDSGVIPVVRLTEVFRQAARSAIITNAHRINRGLAPEFPQSSPDQPAETDLFLCRADEPGQGVATILELVREAIPRRFGLDPLDDIQVIAPMQRGILGVRNLNLTLQAALNPSGPQVERFGWTFRVGDKVMQIVNDYDKEVFNGDIGRIVGLDEGEKQITVRFDSRGVTYGYSELDELVLAYATTIHKSQGCEYPAVVMAIHNQHYVMLQRNLLYTGITRGRKLVVVVGTAKAVGIAARQATSRRRVTTLKQRLIEAADNGPAGNEE